MSVVPGKGDSQDRFDAQSGYSRYATLGLQFAATLAFFTWLGWWVDQKLGTTPILLLVGVLLGFVGSLISIVSKVPPPRARRGSSPPPNSVANDDDSPPHA